MPLHARPAHIVVDDAAIRRPVDESHAGIANLCITKPGTLAVSKTRSGDRQDLVMEYDRGNEAYAKIVGVDGVCAARAHTTD